MDDALIVALQAEQRDAELAAVPLEGRHHLLRHAVGEGARLPVGRHDVIDGRERAVRKGHRLAAEPEHVEGLRARHFVHEVQADEELRLARRQTADAMKVPDFCRAVLIPSRSGL